jgi:alpha-tubulin suppressor-like RCC1 family protein
MRTLAFLALLQLARATEVAAVFSTINSIPITASSYTAAGNTVRLALEFAPPAGTSLTVVNNTGVAQIQGTFANLAQWQVVGLAFGGIEYPYVANYGGGDGNDLVLEWAGKRVVAWGYNAGGAVGDGSTTTRLLPVPVATGALAGKSVLRTAAGRFHTLALTTDGTLVGWGSNGSGQLGTGGLGTALQPVAVDRSGVLADKVIVAIAAGENYSMALCADGTLAAWGANGVGQLGDGTTTNRTRPTAVAFPAIFAGKVVAAIACGRSHTVAILADGTLAAWGYNTDGGLGDGTTAHRSLPVPVKQTGVLAGKTPIAAACGTYHSLVLCADGTLAAWGGGSFGQLGEGFTAYQRTTPVLVNRSGVLAGKTVTAIAAGAQHSLALCADGTIVAWGDNYSGQLGIPGSSKEAQATPTLVRTDTALAGKLTQAVTAAGDRTMAVTGDGTLAAWGVNYYGQLGDGTTTTRRAPTAVSANALLAGERFAAISAGEFHSVALVASPPPPAATTLAAANVAATTATLQGAVNPAGGSVTVAFEYGLTEAYGTTAVATPATVTGITAGVSCPLTGLTAAAVYHYRIVATGPHGTAYGQDLTFATTHLPVFGGYALSTPWQTAASIPLRKILTLASDPDGDAVSVSAANAVSAHGGSVVMTTDSIRYTPPAGFSGTDAVEVTLTDSSGASISGTLTVTVGPAPAAGGAGANPPVLTTLPDGGIGLGFRGIPGRSYVVQRSVNGLGNWLTLATVIADASGKVSFIDESPPAGSAFYRLGLP